jgi:3-oxoadipate enol-lactonase
MDASMIRERRMQTSRCSMAWLEAGTGWPVLFVHGFPLNAGMWRPQLEHVPHGWRFIAPDLRGFGGTRAREQSGSGRVSMDDYAADLADFMDSLQLEDAVIVGLSMGGYVAFALYRQAPARFNGLVLADTRPQADTPAGREGRTRMRDQLARGGPPAVADEMLPKLLSPRASSGDPALVARVRQMMEGAEPDAIDAAIGAMMDRPDSTPDLPRIACATLVLVGELDEITPVADSQATQRAIPRSTLTVVPGAGHLSNLERPEVFNKAIGDFLLARL